MKLDLCPPCGQPLGEDRVTVTWATDDPDEQWHPACFAAERRDNLALTPGDERALKAVGHSLYVAAEHVNRIHPWGERGTQRLMDAGYVARHPHWTGCFTLTEEGRTLYEILMAEEARR